MPENQTSSAIAVISSPLQLAAFNASSAAKAQATIVGNRGMPGDIIFEQSVLNDAKFLSTLDQLIGRQDIEIFLPNSLNLVYFFAVAHRQVSRISFVDEGRLTKRFLEGGFKKPLARHHSLLSTSMRLTLTLPQPLRRLFQKAIALLLRKYVIQEYEKNTSSYAYRTIERQEKPGVVLSHVQYDTSQGWVEFVDLTQNLSFPHNYVGCACLFLHPKYAHDPELVTKLKNGLSSDNQDLLIRPHPNFTRAPELLNDVIANIERSGIHCDIADVSCKHEVSIELFERGVRTFFCGQSSITDTVDAYPDYFEGLRVVNI